MHQTAVLVLEQKLLNRLTKVVAVGSSYTVVAVVFSPVLSAHSVVQCDENSDFMVNALHCLV